jgi:hypothetical protein
MDRLSGHRFVATYFRLYLHAAATNLLVPFKAAVLNEFQKPGRVDSAGPNVNLEPIKFARVTTV